MKPQKFYGALALAKAAVEAHKAGNPMKPVGCRGTATIYTYDPSVDNLEVKPAIFATQILASSAATFVSSINKVLDDGGVVSNLL